MAAEFIPSCVSHQVQGGDWLGTDLWPERTWMVTILQQACGVPVTGHWTSCPGKQDWSVGARRTGCGRGCGHVGEAGSLRGGCQWILKSGVAAWSNLEQEAGQVEGQPAGACEHLASLALCGPKTLLLLAWLSVNWPHTESQEDAPFTPVSPTRCTEVLLGHGLHGKIFSLPCCNLYISQIRICWR